MTAEARITARDATGRVFDQVAQKMKGVERASKGLNASMIGAASRTQSMISAILPTAAVGAAIADGVRRAAELERTTTRLGITSEATAAQVAKAQAVFSRVGPAYGVTSREVASAAEQYVAAGLSLETATGSMDATLRAAKATGSEVNDITSAGISLMQQFGVSVDELPAAFDRMSKSAKLGSFEVKDMARELPAILSAASRAGLTGLDGEAQVLTDLQMVRKVTSSGSEAANRYFNLLTKIYSPETSRNFKKYNVDYLKEIEKGRKAGVNAVDTTLGLIQKLTAGKNKTEKEGILGALFGDMQVGQALVGLLSNLDERARVLKETLGGAAGSIDKDLGKVLDTTASKMERFGANWDRLMTRIGSGAATVLNPVLESINRTADAVEGHDPDYRKKPPQTDAEKKGNRYFNLLFNGVDSTDWPSDVRERQARERGDANLDAGLKSANRAAWLDVVGEGQAAVDRANNPGLPESWYTSRRDRRYRSHDRSQGLEYDRLRANRMSREYAEGQGMLAAARAAQERQARVSGAFTPGPFSGVLPGGFGFGAFGTQGRDAVVGGVPAPGVPMPLARSEPTVQAIASLEEAMKTGAVKATLEGQATIVIALDPALRAQLNAATAGPNIAVTTNGPGSTGSSSPDAAAPARHVGRGDL
jgi:TP901 family phage tail tape measure protein